MDIPKVSISVITYNHARFVRQALDGILMQEVNFPYEVIVGDDVSPDNTREILQEYAARFPDRINLILHEQKGGGIPGKLNFVSTIHAARGEYVAMLDGDDYWTDPHKLQRQVDFLDSHPDFSFCFHNSRLVFDGVEGMDRNYLPDGAQEVVSMEDLAVKPWVIHSGSIMYRRSLFLRVKDSFYSLPSGDIPICLTLAAQGKVGYLPQVMSVYRKNPGGVTFSEQPHQLLKAVEARVFIYETLDRDLEGAFRSLFDKAIRSYQLQMAKYALRAREWPAFSQHLKAVIAGQRDLPARDRNLFRVLRLIHRMPFLEWPMMAALRLRSWVDPNYQY